MDVNYPAPVQVHGFSCQNCADVALAKKDIDPAHPQSGPNGVDAKFDPTARQPAIGSQANQNAVSQAAASRGGVDILA